MVKNWFILLGVVLFSLFSRLHPAQGRGGARGSKTDSYHH